MTDTTTSRARDALGMSAPAEPGKEITVVDRRIAEIKTMSEQFSDAILRASGLTAETLMRDASTAVRNVPKLAEAERGSFFGALMTAAQLGLRPNVASLGHGWVLPFKVWDGRAQREITKAQWILGYQGMVELGYKSGLVSKITAHTIYSNEPHRISYGSEDVLEHTPIFDREERGEMLLHYAVVRLRTGDSLWNVISDADAKDIMARSASGRQGKGPWIDDYEPMARKTALRGLWRWMPKSEVLSLALATDGVTRDVSDVDPMTLSPDDQPETEPTRETVTVTRVAEPAADAPAEPDAAAETGDAGPAAEPPSAPYTMIDGTVRQPGGSTPTRNAYAQRILDKHGDRTNEAVMEVVGENIELVYLSTAEMRQVADVELTPVQT